MTSVMPELSVHHGRAAVDFYIRAFGAVVDYQVGGTDDNPSVVCQLSVDGAPFWVSDEAPDQGNYSPDSLGGVTARVLLVVDDPDALVHRAVAAGAVLVHPVSDEHGWRLGRIRDPYGHHWEVGKPPRPWPPAHADLG
jgi:PhnB protein